MYDSRTRDKEGISATACSTSLSAKSPPRLSAVLVSGFLAGHYPPLSPPSWANTSSQLLVKRRRTEDNTVPDTAFTVPRAAILPPRAQLIHYLAQTNPAYNPELGCRQWIKKARHRFRPELADTVTMLCLGASIDFDGRCMPRAEESLSRPAMCC